MKLFLTTLFIALSCYLFPSDLSKDSIRLLINSASNEELRTRQYIALAKAYIDENVDSTSYYIGFADSLAQKNSLKVGIIHVMNIQGNVLQRKGKLDEAMDIYQEAKKLALAEKRDSALAMLWNNIGIIHTDQGHFDAAIAAYFEAIKFEELIGNKKGIAEGFNNVGVVHYFMSDMDNTLV